jgi:iron complex outermembrane receptor protein
LIFSEKRFKRYLLPVLFLLTSPVYTIAQTASGKIINELNEPVANASLHLLNTNTTVFTDSLGRFFIQQIDKGNYTFAISADGYATIFFEIFISKEETILPDIILKSDYKELGNVFVTAEKKEQSVQSIPVSISVISQKQVEVFQLRNSKEITGIVPNLYSANPGDNRNVTSVRGIVSSSYDPAVTTYIDGVNQFNLDTYIAELLDIERIEVLRGPQGTLYGRNSMGGVINIITQKPSDKLSGFAEANVGNYGFLGLSTSLNVPLIKNKLILRIASVYNKINGYYKNEFDHSQYDKQHSILLNSSLKYIINHHWSAELNVKQQLNRNNGAFTLISGKQQAFEKPFKINQNAAATMVDNIVNGSLNLSYTGSHFNFNSLSSFQSNYRYYKKEIDADFSPLDAISIFNNYGRNWNYGKVLTQEFKFSSPANNPSKISWTAGGYLFYQKTPGRQSTVFGKDAMQAGIPDSNFSIENISTAKSNGQALFGQISFNPTKKVELIAGLRYDHEEKSLTVSSNYHKQTTSFPIIADTSAKSKFNVLSPKIGFLYKLATTVNLYFNYSRGFRAGGLTQLSSDPSQPPLFTYKPEYSNNAEIGIKAQFGNKVQFNITIFYTGVNDAQVPSLILPDAIIITKNAGSLKSTGFENEIAIQIIKGLSANYSFGFTHAVFKETKASQGGQQIELKGRHQVFTPNVTSFLNLRYQTFINSKRNLKFEISGQWFYIGRQYFDIANTLEQSPYNLVNANAGITFKKFRLFVWSKNLTDTRYIDYAYDFGAVHLGNPATFGVAMAVVF